MESSKKPDGKSNKKMPKAIAAEADDENGKYGQFVSKMSAQEIKLFVEASLGHWNYP